MTVYEILTTATGTGAAHSFLYTPLNTAAGTGAAHPVLALPLPTAGGTGAGHAFSFVETLALATGPGGVAYPVTLGVGISKSFLLPTAVGYGAASSPSTTITDSNITLALETATCAGQALPIFPLIGTHVLGDFYGAPIVLSGLSGSVTVDLASATTELGEGGDGAGTWYGTASIWFRPPPLAGLFTGSVVAPSGVTLGLDYASGADMFAAVPDDTVSGTGATVTISDFVSSGGTEQRIRLGLWGGALTGTVTFTWSLDRTSGRTAGPVVQVVTPTLATPESNLSVSLFNAAPGETVTFLVDGGGTLSVVADSAGVISNALIDVPKTLGVGTHTVAAVSSLGTVTGSFQVASVITPPATPGTDAAPTAVTQTTPTTRWVWQDKRTGGLGNWVMPFNPDTAQRIELGTAIGLTPEHVVSQAGPFILWEGLDRGQDWTFSGIVLDQTSHDKLVAYCNLRRRFYIIDHKLRAHTVVINSLELVPMKIKDINYPYAHNYKVLATVLKVVQL